MRFYSKWVHSRQVTIGLAAFFIAWYGLQLAVLYLFGEDIAKWWFYFQLPPNVISPGLILAPLSHKLDTLTHIGGNLLLLVMAGCLAEPYIGGKRILILVIGLGYLGTYLANLSVFVHQLWMLAGASGGILALWGYAGLRMRQYASEFLSEGAPLSRRGIETVGSVALLIGIPAIFIHQTLLVAQPHSGHIFGLLLGVLFYIVEFLFDETDMRANQADKF
jgi:membrane associated rhomboid family serine protease